MDNAKIETEGIGYHKSDSVVGFSPERGREIAIVTVEQPDKHAAAEPAKPDAAGFSEPSGATSSISESNERQLSSTTESPALTSTI